MCFCARSQLKQAERLPIKEAVVAGGDLTEENVNIYTPQSLLVWTARLE